MIVQLDLFDQNSIIPECEPVITYKTYINETEDMPPFLSFDSSTKPTYYVESSDLLIVGYYLVKLEATITNGYFTESNSIEI